jgi:hypothetical protein
MYGAASGMKKLTGALAVLVLLSTAAQATQGGGSIYAVGNENFTCCALAPPGLYGIVYAQALTADKVKGNDGQVVTPPTFKVRAQAIAPRLVWVSPYQLAGASFGVHAIFPIVRLDVNVAPGIAQTKTGRGTSSSVRSSAGITPGQLIHLVFPPPRGMLPSVRSLIDNLTEHLPGGIQISQKPG